MIIMIQCYDSCMSSFTIISNLPEFFLPKLTRLDGCSCHIIIYINTRGKIYQLQNIFAVSVPKYTINIISMNTIVLRSCSIYGFPMFQFTFSTIQYNHKNKHGLRARIRSFEDILLYSHTEPLQHTYKVLDQ